MNSIPQPPRLLLRFFRWLCHPDYVEDIEGDLLERFEHKAQEKGATKARWWFVGEVIRLIRPALMGSLEGNFRMNHYGMLKNYLVVAFRSLRKNRVYAFLNIAGLVLGVAFSFVLFKYVGFHLMKDQFHAKKDRIYAIRQTLVEHDIPQALTKETYNGIVDFAKANYPEVSAGTRYAFSGEQLITVKREDGQLVKFNERGIPEVDPDFLRIFSIDFVNGDPQSALDQPGSLLITESTAKRYFGTENPMDKTITSTTSWGKQETLRITGVITDMPTGSTFQFAFLKTLKGTVLDDGQPNWEFPYYASFLLLQKADDAQSVASKLSRDISNLTPFKERSKEVVFHLDGLSDLHLTDSQKMLALVGILLLVLTWINYTNLSGARSMGRGREFGVRKVVGSNRRMLIGQFVCEGMVLYLLASLMAIGLVMVCYPYLMTLTSHQLLPVSEFDSSVNLTFIFFLLFGSLLSSAYPALSVLHFDIGRLLKGHLSKGVLLSGFRKGLIVFQLTVSVIMIIGVSVIYAQMKYVQDKDLGVSLDRTIVFNPPKDARDFGEKFERLTKFKNGLMGLHAIENVMSATTMPGSWGRSPTDFMLRTEEGGVSGHFNLIGVDYGYFDYFNLTFVVGQGFKKGNFHRTRQLAVLNEAAANALGFQKPEDALHQIVTNKEDDLTLEVIGVIRDYHHHSLKVEIAPQVYHFNPFTGFVCAKIKAIDKSGYDYLASILSQAEGVWNEIYPDQAFDFYFLDEAFNAQYQEEILFRKIFASFTIISVIITVMGFFGLSMYISLRRRKEVGIRKTFGATVIQILLLFTKDFIGQIMLAILIGVPLASYLMQRWLESFSYRTEIHPWLLIFPCLLLIGLTITTIMLEVTKVATANPVQSLRDE